MDKSLLKSIGIAGLFALGGSLIWILAKVGNLNLSLGDIAFIVVLVLSIAYIGYALIKFYTGASVSDIDNLKETMNKLIEIVKMLSTDGDDSSGSNETTSS